MGISNKLADGFVGYSVDLSRYSAGVEKQVRSLLKQVELDLVDSLNSYDVTAPGRLAYRERRLTQLLKEVRGSLGTSYNGIKQTVDSHLIELAALEVTASKGILNNAIGYNLMSSGLSPELLKSIATNTLFEGAPAKEWWSRQNKQTFTRFKDQVRLGMLSGESVNGIVRRVRGTSTGRRVGYKLKGGKQRFLTEFKGGVLDTSTRHATTLTRTAVQSVSQSARYELFKSNDDVVKGFQHLSTLDKRTSSVCIARSGLTWTLKGTPLGGHAVPFKRPPLHFQCRSTLIPLLYSFEEIAGNISPKKRAQLRKYATKSTQSSMDGQVADDLNYGGWLKAQSKGRQLDILGPTKYRMWKDGQITFRDLVDQSGNPLAVAQLVSKYGDSSNVVSTNLRKLGFKNLNIENSLALKSLNNVNLSLEELAVQVLGRRNYKSAKIEATTPNTLTLVGKGGDGVVELQRTLDFKNGIAEHNYLKLTKEGQLKGTGKSFLKRQVSLYEDLKFKHVELVANIDVGGYAWARYGFDAVDWGVLRLRLIDRLKLLDIDGLARDRISRILSIDHPAAIQTLASFDYKKQGLGKKLLMGTEWEGRLELNDPDAMKVFWSYLNPSNIK